MGIRNFLTSRTFLKHLILATGISLAAIFLVLLSLKLYTRHGETIAVPDLYGYTEVEFREILEKLDLKYRITDSTYIENVTAGGVIDQVPEPGHGVKINRTLFITINAIAPEQVTIPRLTDISLRQSLAQLESAGLLPGEVTYKPSEFKNLVLQAKANNREVFEGDKVAKGTRIDLIVGSGQEMELVYLPVINGLTLETARQIIAESMLSVGAVIYDNTIISRYDSLNARVWKQQPDYRTIMQVNIGSSVDIWVSMDENKFIEDIEEENVNTENQEL
jgi:eukaryotic-like serine/threonine-protein kinase